MLICKLDITRTLTKDPEVLVKAMSKDGNLYFANEEAQKSFKMDYKSSVNGKQEMKN